VRAVQFVGPARFLAWLRNAGVDSLSGHANVYGDGLALGNGELSLYELVQAYTVLARMGDFAPLSLLADHTSTHAPAYRIISEDLASLLADILSDPLAREKEFGRYSVLNFPYQTAVKTGTSSDYRDAWAIGFNDRYTVGVWLGNMDYTEMNEVTGSTGPALALRAIFNELNRNRRVRPLYFSDKLAPQAVCVDSGQTADGVCEARDEWFVAGTGPGQASVDAAALRLRKPSKGLLLAMDPRIPDDQEYFEFAVAGNNGIEFVDWYVNEQFVGRTPRRLRGRCGAHIARGGSERHEPDGVDTSPARTPAVSKASHRGRGARGRALHRGGARRRGADGSGARYRRDATGRDTCRRCAGAGEGSSRGAASP
jgi:penicillin-binding protein 1C